MMTEMELHRSLLFCWMEEEAAVMFEDEECDGVWREYMKRGPVTAVLKIQKPEPRVNLSMTMRERKGEREREREREWSCDFFLNFLTQENTLFFHFELLMLHSDTFPFSLSHFQGQEKEERSVATSCWKCVRLLLRC